MGRSNSRPILDACIGDDGVLVRHFPLDTTLDVVNMITRDEAFWLHRCFWGETLPAKTTCSRFYNIMLISMPPSWRA